MSTAVETFTEDDVHSVQSRPDKVNDVRSRCCWNGKYFFDALKATITRQLFLFHAILGVWQVTLITKPFYWLLALTFVGLIVETLVVLCKRRGQEWNWFQWSVFLYLICIVPPIWILELHKLERWAELVNSTYVNKPINYQIIEVEGLIPFQMAPDDWVVALEQTLLVIIIIGRWLMPKGDLTREQLSGLLLVHLGTASDIVDFLTLLAEENTLEESNHVFVYAILSVWTWSLLQFPFVVTAKKERQGTIIDDEKDELEKETVAERLEKVKRNVDRKLNYIHGFLETEAWGIFVSMVMQDGPFVIMRLVAIFKYKVVTYTNYFFACKNTLVLMLQIYRLVSLYSENQKAKKVHDMEAARGMTMHQLYTGCMDVTDDNNTRQPQDRRHNTAK